MRQREAIQGGKSRGYKKKKREQLLMCIYISTAQQIVIQSLSADREILWEFWRSLLISQGLNLNQFYVYHREKSIQAHKDYKCFMRLKKNKKKNLDAVQLLRENSQEVIREVAKQRWIPIPVASNLSVTWWGPCFKPFSDTVIVRINWISLI